MKIQLLKGYYIRNLDDKNWVVAVMKTVVKEGITTGVEYEYVDGYYPSFECAISRAIDKLLLKVEDKDEFDEILNKIYYIKHTHETSE